MPQQPPAYTFRDDGEAAERLRILAQVYDAEMRAFLRAAAPPRVRLAVDLGCGPGHTTRLVAETTAATDTVGIDNSGQFLSLARAGAGPGLRFLLHDVSQAPLPVRDADVIFCHLLLTHLPAPEAALRAWLPHLRPGGRLLIDEVEWIQTADPVFRDYLAVVDALVASRGGALYVGPRLSRFAAPPGFTVAGNTVTEAPVAAADAVAMFSRNLRTWRDDPAVRARYPAAEIDRIAAGLAERAASRGRSITWGFRQLVIQREAAPAS